MLSKIKRKKRLKVHGFLNRAKNILKARRNKGRQNLSVSVGSK